MEDPAIWTFVGPFEDRTWRANRVDGQIKTFGPFANLSEAKAKAVSEGFRPTSQYWVVETNGRATHYRPGKTPVNLPSGEIPKDWGET